MRSTLRCSAAESVGAWQIEKTDKMGSKVNTLTQQFYQVAAMPRADQKDLAFAYVKDLDAAVLRCRTSVRRMFDEALQDEF